MSSSAAIVSAPEPSWDVNTNVANVLAMAASIASILMWLSPIRAIWTSETSIYKSKSAQGVNTAFGYVAGAIQCVLWCMYATTRLETMSIPLFVNAFGAILNTSFVGCYWWYSTGEQRRAVKLQLALLLPTILAAIAVWVYENKNDAVGYIADAVNVLMYFGPLAAAGKVIRKRSTDGLIFLQLVLTVVASLLWFAYGLYIFDIPVMIPNALGIFFSIAQVALYYWAKKAQRTKSLLDETTGDAASSSNSNSDNEPSPKSEEEHREMALV